MNTDGFLVFFLKSGERLKCDHCTHIIEGADEKDVIVYFEESAKSSDSDVMVRCQTCHDILQALEETEANEE